jgi:hypothetical protein
MHRITSVRGFAAISLAITMPVLALTFCFAGPAVAATPNAGITCTTLSGSSASATLSGCSDVAGTGGSGTIPFKTKSKIMWANGKITVINPFNPTEISGTLCPAGTEEFRLSGPVTKDTTGSVQVGGKASGLVCLDMTANTVVNAPGKKFKIV